MFNELMTRNLKPDIFRLRSLKMPVKVFPKLLVEIKELEPGMLFLITQASTNIGSVLLLVLYVSAERGACVLDFGPIYRAPFFL